MAATSEVDGSWWWTPCAVRCEIRASAAWEGARWQGKVGEWTAHRDRCGVVTAATAGRRRGENASITSGENIRKWKNDVLPVRPNQWAVTLVSSKAP
jgi:hypothetical protein